MEAALGLLERKGLLAGQGPRRRRGIAVLDNGLASFTKAEFVAGGTIGPAHR